MQKYFSTKEDAPIHDQAKEDRLKRMGKVNQIGRAVGVLGDALTLGLGGKVNKTQPDRVQPMLYQQYQALMDKEKADQDAYRQRNYLNNKENLKMGINEEGRKESMQLSAENLKAQRDTAKAIREEANAKWKIERGDKLSAAEQAALDRAESRKIAREGLALRRDANDIAREKANAGKDKPFKPIEVKDDSGAKVKLSQADWSKLFQDAQADDTFTKDHLQALLSNYKAMPDGGRQQIAADYYNHLQKQRAEKKTYENAINPPPYVIPGTATKQPAAVKTKPSFFQ